MKEAKEGSEDAPISPTVLEESEEGEEAEEMMKEDQENQDMECEGPENAEGGEEETKEPDQDDPVIDPADYVEHADPCVDNMETLPMEEVEYDSFWRLEEEQNYLAGAPTETPQDEDEKDEETKTSPKTEETETKEGKTSEVSIKRRRVMEEKGKTDMQDNAVEPKKGKEKKKKNDAKTDEVRDHKNEAASTAQRDEEKDVPFVTQLVSDDEKKEECRGTFKACEWNGTGVSRSIAKLYNISVNSSTYLW